MSGICPSCGASVPDGAAACATCGAPPLHGQPSITYDAVTTRWFGVAPASLLLGLAGACAVAAIVLFVFGTWPVGLVLAGAVLLFLAAFGEVATRKPDTHAVTRSLSALQAARGRAVFAVEAAAARTRATRELTRARNELFGVGERRAGRVKELGEAVVADDEERVSALRAEIGELDRLAAEKEVEMQTIAARAREAVARARLPVQDTQMVEVPGDPDEDPPSPAPAYPPPDEGDPPEPARIPEPYPPDEITTPEGVADRRDS